MLIDRDAVGFEEAQMAFDEKPRRSAGWVVDRHAWLGIEDAGHEAGHLGRRVELARALPLPLSELADKVLVGPAEEIGLDVLEAEPVFAERLDQSSEPVVVHDGLACCRRVEIDGVDDTLEPRVLTRHCSNRVGKNLAEFGGLSRYEGPSTLRGNIEPHEAVVFVDDRTRGIEISNLLGDALNLIVEHVREPLEENERENVVLELRRVERPAHLASRIPEPR